MITYKSNDPCSISSCSFAFLIRFLSAVFLVILFEIISIQVFFNLHIFSAFISFFRRFFLHFCIFLHIF